MASKSFSKILDEYENVSSIASNTALILFDMFSELFGSPLMNEWKVEESFLSVYKEIYNDETTIESRKFLEQFDKKTRNKLVYYSKIANVPRIKQIEDFLEEVVDIIADFIFTEGSIDSNKELKNKARTLTNSFRDKLKVFLMKKFDNFFI